MTAESPKVVSRLQELLGEDEEEKGIKAPDC